MSDAFWHSEDLLEEAVTSDVDAIDPAQPGFASLLPLLRSMRGGNGNAAILAAYHGGLSEQVAQSRAQLASLVVPETIQEPARHAMAAMETILDRMDEVLACVDGYLDSEDEKLLEDAITYLTEVHRAIGSVRSDD